MGRYRRIFVLAGEEALKAEVLYSTGIGIPVFQSALHSILRRHLDRHVLAGLAIGFSFWSRRLISLSATMPSLPVPMLSPEQQRHWEEVLSRLRLDSSADEDQVFTRKCQEWWAKANALKNRGLYLDPTEDRWVCPESVSVEDYLTSLEVVEAFLRSAKAFCLAWETLADDARQDALVAIKSRISQKSFEEQLVRTAEDLWAAEEWPVTHV
jgi:AbiV family abortive infection protein